MWPPKIRAAILTGKHCCSFSVGMDVTGPKMEIASATADSKLNIPNVLTAFPILRNMVEMLAVSNYMLFLASESNVSDSVQKLLDH